MEATLDRASPKRGSLTSLHRQSSGSLSHNSKLSSPSGTLQVNNAGLYSLCKDLDKFTRYFIIKSVQVIVQSRMGGSKKFKTDCKPNGNDWFNISIPDVAEISDKVKAALDSEGLSIKSSWRVCCEISLRTNDGGRVVLEHWVITNKTNFNSNQKLNNSQSSARSNLANRSSLFSSSNNGITTNNTTTTTTTATNPLSVINSSTTSARIRPSNNVSSRTRLNSIDDSTGNSNCAANTLLMGINNENVDIKASTSCFSLSSAPKINSTTTNEFRSRVSASPSTNSLNNTATSTQDQSTHSAINNDSSSSNQQQGSIKTSATSSIYTIYNRMSLLLKTIITTAHIVPAYRLASRTTQSDSCKIFYRVYTCPVPYHNSTAARGSIEDISYNPHSDSPTRRLQNSNSSFGSLNIREFVAPDEVEHFCPILKLGSIRTDVNELDISLCYRIDMRNSNQFMRSPRSRDMYSRALDEDCITAAKQLLAGNEYTRDNHSKVESQRRENNNNTNNINHNGTNETLDFLDQPLRPAFAVDGRAGIQLDSKQNEIIDSAFDGLLKNKDNGKDDALVNVMTDAVAGQTKKLSDDDARSTNAQSDPIQVPSRNYRTKQDLCSNLSTGSTPKSLTDSYVFVDLNPPFASEEQNDISSFFHGPSPAFSNGFDCSKDVDELTNQLAVIEANASQFDDFVDEICASEEEEAEREHN